jgi:hypothetical protein
MMENSVWTHLFKWVLWIIIMAIVMGWLGRNRLRNRNPDDSRKLAQPPGILITGSVCFLIFTGFAVVSNSFSNETTTWWTTAIFAGFALLGLFIIIDFFMNKHDVSEDGILYRKLNGKRILIRWTELASVKYAPVMKWFVLKSRTGAVARISVMLMGLPEFASLLLDHTSHEIIDQRTREILKTTAKGNPPAVWM